MKSDLNTLEARKLALGEKVEFDRYLTRAVDTKYGVGIIVSFVKDKKVHRKCFAQGGMLEWLKEHPDADSITLIEKIEDGDLTYNAWG